MNGGNATDMNFLSRREIHGLTKRLREEAHLKCKDAVREYGECSEKHIFPLNCKRAMEKMDDCLRQINNPERVNQAKLEYMKLRRERRERYEARDARQKQAAAQKETETAAAKAPPLAGAQEG